MNKVIIEVKNLTKKYGEFTAVDNLSFDVYENEIFGLLGPNGAGKTTTMEIIETLRHKTSGTILVDGHNVETHANEIKQCIGVQLQSAGYYPNLSLTQLLQVFAGLYNIQVPSTELLGKVNLLDKRNSKYAQLSGGQKQRFSIATTLINKPKIIFLDEPTTGLDPQARRNLWDLIRELKVNGTTVVLTTHYMDEAEELCDRIAIIDSGKIVSMDTPDNLIDHLVSTGFERKKQVKLASLEDVFLNLTGREWRDE